MPMKKSCSFFILDCEGRPVRRFTISRVASRLLMALILAGVAWAGYVSYDYARLERNEKNTHVLNTHIDRNRRQIVLQKRQIEQFTKELGTLKSNLASLNQYEQKIRTVANLDASPNRESRFGVGGSPPDDLNASPPVRGRQSDPIKPAVGKGINQSSADPPIKNHFAAMPDRIDDADNLLAALPARLPVNGPQTGRFGAQPSAAKGKTKFHQGIDISVPQGTPIVATADGVVAFIGHNGAMGQTIVIDHGYGLVTRYGNCQMPRVKEGDPVKGGEPIAVAGAPDHTPHVNVHYEVLLNGVPVNPDADLVSANG